MFTGLMKRMVPAASDLIATDRDLTQSVDGVQCLALESMHYNNYGRLRDAWLVIRRALAVAQLIGIDKPAISAARTLETSTSTRRTPPDMWLSLVQSDQYHPMALGLTTGVSTLQPADHATLATLPSFEQLERMHCYAADLILLRSRNPSTFDKQKVDTMLKDAAACMPASWWLPAHGALLVGFDDDKAGSLKEEAFVEVGRVMKHLIHYHLVIQLHLPDFLRSHGPDAFYSRLTAINTSRDLVTRYLTFRNASTQSYWYCRGIDMLAFIASTVICLGHILAQNDTADEVGQSAARGFLGFLVHQRLTDRGLLDSVLDRMRLLTEDGTDKISLNIISILQPLLDMETRSASGTRLQLSFDKDQGATRLPRDAVSSARGDSLSIHIPCSGVLHIRPIASSKPRSRPSADSGQAVASHEVVDSFKPPDNSQYNTVVHATEVYESVPVLRDHNGDRDCAFSPGHFDIDLDDWALQGVDSVFFENLLRGSTFDYDDMPPYFDPPARS